MDRILTSSRMYVPISTIDIPHSHVGLDEITPYRRYHNNLEKYTKPEDYKSAARANRSEYVVV